MLGEPLGYRSRQLLLAEKMKRKGAPGGRSGGDPD